MTILAHSKTDQNMCKSVVFIIEKFRSTDKYMGKGTEYLVYDIEDPATSCRESSTVRNFIIFIFAR